MREEAQTELTINWLREIPQEKWTLTWDGNQQWGHMTTNLVESINLILKKIRNFPICALVKSTYIRCNTLFNQRGREVATMITYGQVYMQVPDKAMENA